MAIGIGISTMWRRGGGYTIPAPFSSDMLFFLSGDIIEDGGNYYFEDKTVNDRHFLITGKDFATDWATGFPYKSASTISAPAGDAALIAADLNNFLYDVGGTPNAIPVVSLFQDIDYEHKLFCKHSAQVVDGNGVETYEPRVSEIAFYSTVKSGADLTTCQTYYSVPTEAVSHVWWIDPVNGNDTTGNGTKATPHKTLSHTLNHCSTGDTVYLKTGQNTEQWTVWVGVNIIGVGLCEHYCNTNNPLYLQVNNITVKNIIITPNGVSNGIYCVSKGDITLERLYVKLFSSYSIWMRGEVAKKIILKDSVINGKMMYTTTSLDIIGCFVAGKGKDGITMQTPAENTNTLTLKYNKLRIPTNSVGDDCYVINNGSNNLIVFNNDITVVNQSSLFKHLVSNIANIEIEYNTYTGANSTAFLDLQVNKCNYNRVSFTGSYVPIKIPTIAIAAVEIKGNIIDNGGNQCIEITGVNAGLSTLTIDGNTLITRTVIDNGYYGGIVLGGSGDTTERTYTAIVKNNRLIGPKAVGQVVGCHSLVWASNMKTLQISHNYFEGSGLYSMVIKSVIDDFECTNSYIFGNLFSELGYVIRGVGSIAQYGNTFSTTDGTKTLVLDNENVGSICANSTIKNNIIYTNAASGMLIIATDIDLNFDSDYNVLYPLGQTPAFSHSSGNKTLAEWQALGYDTNSIIANPNLVNLIPATAIEGADDLGATYEDGLDVSTDWGSLTETPTVVTKKQGANWQIGAYIK